MQLSNVQEETGGVRKLYLGIENFTATAVNPTMKELNDMGIPAKTEPVYVTKVMRDFGSGEKEYDAVNLRIYLDNQDTANPIKTQVNYQVIKSTHLSSTGKLKVINKYGSDAWLEETHIDAGTVPPNYHWYVNEGVKVAYRGEDSFVAFIKAYRNLPNITMKSTPDVKKKGVAILSLQDWAKLFSGDFTDIRDAIMGIGDKGKCGFLLGVRHLEDKDVQTLYRQSPLKRFVKKVGGNEYLTKDVLDSQKAGAYADATFDVANYKLVEYDANAHKVTASDPADFAYAPSDNGAEEDDDLPF